MRFLTNDWAGNLAALATHAAMREWSAVTIPQVGTDLYADVIGQRLSRAYNVNADTQRQIYLVGTDSSGSPANLARVAKSSDGSQFDPSPSRLTTISSFTAPSSGHAGAANELILVNGSTKFAYSRDDAVTWALSSAYASAIQTVHYVEAGAAAGYYALTGGSTNNCAKASVLTDLAASPTLSTIGSGGFNFSTTQSFADNGSVILVSGTFSGGSAIYRSTDGGASWALSLSYNGSAVNTAICFSEHWQLFFAIDDAGELHASVDGLRWDLRRNGLTAANGFLVSARALVACGPVIAVTSGTGNSDGVAYSLDTGRTWNYHYMGYGGLAPSNFRSLNGRLYALGGKTLWRSGVLDAPAVELL